MKAAIVLVSIGAFAVLIAPIRRLRNARQPQPARLDPAAYAAMLAEAERIASPFKRYVQAQIAEIGHAFDDEPGGDFPEVDALLERAGILV